MSSGLPPLPARCIWPVQIGIVCASCRVSSESRTSISTHHAHHAGHMLIATQEEHCTFSEEVDVQHPVYILKQPRRVTPLGPFQNKVQEIEMQEYKYATFLSWARLWVDCAVIDTLARRPNDEQTHRCGYRQSVACVVRCS